MKQRKYKLFEIEWAWLTGFHLRFNKTLLMINLKNKPLIINGNECERRLKINPLQ